MIRRQITNTLLFIFLLANIGNSQNIKDEDLEYQYIQLPQTDIRNLVKNYNVKLVPLFEANNKKLMAEYEIEVQKAKKEFENKTNTMPQQQVLADAQFEKEIAQYDKDLKEAEDKYAKEMAEYNKKSIGSKILEKELLGQNNKPSKQLPNKPYRKIVTEPYLKTVTLPVLHTSYDYPAVCNTYLRLYGFEQNSEKAIDITVTLSGFENTKPTVITTQQNEMRVSNGQSSSYPVNYYSTEFSYRHPMSLLIKMPDGKILQNISPPEFNNYTVYKSPGSKVQSNTSNEMFIKTAEEKCIQSNLAKINDLMNNMYGFKPMPRKAILYYVKNKDQEYTDLWEAFNDAKMGLKFISQDETMANEKLAKAIEKWKAAFLQADLTNKNARIDEDVAKAIGYNLLEVYFATKNTTEGFSIIESMNKMDLSKKEIRRKEEFELLYLELKKRK